MGKLLEIKGFNGIKKKPRMTCFTRKGFKRFFIFNIVKDKSFSSSLGSLSRLPSRPRFFPFISPPPVSPLPPRSLLPLFFFSKGKIPSAQHFFTHEKKKQKFESWSFWRPYSKGQGLAHEAAQRRSRWFATLARTSPNSQPSSPPVISPSSVFRALEAAWHQRKNSAHREWTTFFPPSRTPFFLLFLPRPRKIWKSPRFSDENLSCLSNPLQKQVFLQDSFSFLYQPRSSRWSQLFQKGNLSSSIQPVSKKQSFTPWLISLLSASFFPRKSSVFGRKSFLFIQPTPETGLPPRFIFLSFNLVPPHFESPRRSDENLSCLSNPF